jgi:hypothetical protein
MEVAGVAAYGRKTPKKYKENKEKTSRRGRGRIGRGERRKPAPSSSQN